MSDNNNINNRVWQSPWRYKESVVVVVGIVFIGLLLQYTIGDFDFSMLQWPVNGIVGGVLISFLLLFSFKRKSNLYQWLSGIPMAVTLICALTTLGIIMGLTSRLTSSWPFVLIYFLTLLSLGALIVRRMIPFRLRDYAFYLNHIGLWFLLFSAGMGASDIKRFVMHVEEGQTEWRVYNDRNEVLELPIAIHLNDFMMEEYPPKLVIVNKETGDSRVVDSLDGIEIDAQHFVTRTRPEPKRFVSDINVYSEDGKQAHALLEVNKPYKHGHWMLYQFGYDNEAGIASTYSSIELVYDPWVVPVYCGIILLACGSVCMLRSGNRRKEASDDLE